ncbi:MAG: hypothetical protein V3U87_06075 [Methylococcaceae bacterium]
MLIYGVREEKHLPIEIDDGVDHKKYTREWLEQVIVSNVAPIIDGVKIIQIPINENNSLYVIDVPKSSRGPHQESGTKRYYKRYNFKSSPMEDYEINDVRNRSYITPPLIKVELIIEHCTMVYIEISNIGDIPAIDVVTKLPPEFTWKNYKEPPPFFERPVKYFPSGKKFSFMYNTYQKIVNDDSVKQEFSISVEYINSRDNKKYSDSFYFDLSDSMYTRYEEPELHRLGKVIKESVGELTKKIEKLGEYTEEISRIADPSGLSLSVTTLNNLHALSKGNDVIKKLDPSYCDYRIFKEVLEINDEIAFKLDHFFRFNQRNENLQDIEGLDKVLIEKIEKRFIIENI